MSDFRHRTFSGGKFPGEANNDDLRYWEEFAFGQYKSVRRGVIYAVLLGVVLGQGERQGVGLEAAQVLGLGVGCEGVAGWGGG